MVNTQALGTSDHRRVLHGDRTITGMGCCTMPVEGMQVPDVGLCPSDCKARAIGLLGQLMLISEVRLP